MNTNNHIRELLLRTIPYPSADRSGLGWQHEMQSQPQIIDNGLRMINHLHNIYNTSCTIPDAKHDTDHNINATTVPMTKASKARIRAITTALNNLSPEDQTLLYWFFDILSPYADQRSWLYDNRRVSAKEEFAVAPQAWILRAGVKQIGEILERKWRYKNLYEGLQHRDECWREDEGANHREFNGMFWLGKAIEMWGEEVKQRGAGES